MNRSLVATAVFAAVYILQPAPLMAQIEEVKIGVNGLTCNLCAAGLERSLRRLEGVSSVEIAVGEEAATVRLKAGASFDPEKFRAAVKSAGQEAKNFELRLSASVQRESGRYTLQPAGGAALPVRATSAAKLEPFVGRIVRARAKVFSSPPSPLELELTDVAIQ
jgi:copper chaperone CopZ